MSKEKKYKYSPSAYKVEEPDLSKYSEEDIKLAEELIKKEDEEKEKKKSKVALASTIFSLLSTAYAIITTSTFLAQNWTDSPICYALLAVMIIYIVVFIVMIALVLSKKSIKSGIAVYKKTLKIFKAFANVIFIALSATQLAGLASLSGLKNWVVFGFTLTVAIVQLALKISKLVLESITKGVSKKFKVSYQTYKDNKLQEDSLTDKIKEKLYK